MADPAILHTEVSRAMESVRSAGEKPTIDNVRAALGNRGSRIMILRMIAEVIAAEAAMNEFGGMLPEPEEKFKLVDLPQQPQTESPVEKQMQTALDALMDEFAPILGCSRGVFEQIERLEAEKRELAAELKDCQAELSRYKPVTSPESVPKSSQPKGTEPVSLDDIRLTLGL